MVTENPLIIPGVSIDPQSRAAFMEWLSAHDARVRAEAWDEGWEAVARSLIAPLDENGMRPTPTNPYREGADRD